MKKRFRIYFANNDLLFLMAHTVMEAYQRAINAQTARGKDCRILTISNF
jgi:hypothetical protein